MPVLLTCDAIAKSFGSRTVFSGISLSLHDDDRLGVIGPNGAGKSTFLQIVGGAMAADEGTVSVRKGVRLAMVVQDPRFDPESTVREIIAAKARETEDKDLEVSKIISRVGFDDAGAKAGRLSGGWRKRLAIAAALAEQPDVLLLDEPTNHLDVEGILWLERLVTSAAFASIFVTHDRYFLENVATRVAEINRAYPAGLFTAAGHYSRFLEKRSEFLRAQAKEQQALENLVQREIEWLRRGAKARTSKSKARIDAAYELQDQLVDVAERNTKGTATVDFTSTGRLTKRLLAAEGIAKSMGGRLLFDNLSFTLGPRTRLGVLGANGSGKSTLLRILAGEIEPDGGRVQRAEGLRIAWFDQDRDKLDSDQPLRRALAPEGDTVIFRDRPQHVAGWAARFLFRQEQLELPLHRLSGGERARVHIARLMLQPADILLLDEPTNDLDIPTLEVLESNLVDFPGAIVLVTHDRFLLDRVSKAILALDGTGGAEFFAELAQWEQAAAVRKSAVKTARENREPAPVASKKKLTYLEAREWEQIETKVAEAEQTLKEKRDLLEVPEVVSNAALLTQAVREIEAAETEVDRLYTRWAELEAKRL
ncbi:MAG TPA: ABC-F family ATP-binding cassette domain-containing protein [Bryobacteraceae bacterium]|jgi:ATP-binding cassette subfamily F protein uup|nr:ABC-F family ATP-binding cassette domain-containing protein [Bryobacteraceae bacterium]